jgi:hypothetical protein
MSRPDTYCLHLAAAKANIATQIVHCTATLNVLSETIADQNYNEAATDLEKSNFNTLIQLITNGLTSLQDIIWDEEVNND